MINKKSFWLALMIGLLAVYATALALFIQGQTQHVLVRIVL